MVQDFREVIAWQRAHALILEVYKAATSLPPGENFGLLLQLRRSAASIAMRIAEGCGRGTKAEFIVELNRSRAAAHELEYLLILCHDLGYFTDQVYADLTADLIEVRKIVSGLMRTVSSSQ